MIGLLITFLASSFCSVANFFIRKNLNDQGSPQGYFLASFALSLLASMGMNFSKILHVPISIPMLLTGCIAGCLIVLMMNLTAAALTRGPAGLTFAFQTSGSVFPAAILFLLFGTAFGFTLTSFMLGGFCLIIAGLFWAAWPSHTETSRWKKGWLFYALSIFTIHLLLLVLIQWRCLAFTPGPSSPFILFHCSPEQDVWFMPGLFGIAFLLQVILSIRAKHWPTSKEILYGSLGGISNGLGTHCLLLATIFASSLLKGILFPLFTIGIIMICNLWSFLLYSEKVNWRANILCSAGILLASFSD